MSYQSYTGKPIINPLTQEVMDEVSQWEKQDLVALLEDLCSYPDVLPIVHDVVCT